MITRSTSVYVLQSVLGSNAKNLETLIREVDKRQRKSPHAYLPANISSVQ